MAKKSNKGRATQEEEQILKPVKSIKAYLPGVGKVYYPVVAGSPIRSEFYRTATEAEARSNAIRIEVEELTKKVDAAKKTEPVDDGMIKSTAAVGTPGIIQGPPPAEVV